VTVSPGLLRLAATNTELTIVAETPAVSAESEGQAYIPAKKLREILKEAPDGDVTVRVKKNMATISAGKGSGWDLRLPDGSAFPELPDLSLAEFRPADRAKLLAGLKTVRHTVGRDAGRPPLMQVSIAEGHAPDGPYMAVTSSDGPRMTRAPVGAFPFPVRILAGGLDHLIKLLAGSQAEEVQVAVAEPGPVFRAGPVTLMVSRWAPEFPDVDELILRHVAGNKDTLTVDREELTAAIRRVRINAPDNSAVVLHLDEDSLVVEARDKHDAATETVQASWSGESRVLVVSHGSLLEMLAAHPSRSCVFRLGPDKGKRRSMVMLADEGSGVTGVIAQMPPGIAGY
jgi:DNA polymerase III sliding clamp (beta) subunit (PCNA family)